MDDLFKIFVEQLKGGAIDDIEATFDPAFLDVNEKELIFKDPIMVQGQAFVSEKDLILELSVSTQVSVPCSICNGWVTVPLEIPRWIHDVSLKDVKAGVYLFKDPLRETILLEIPPTAECHGGHCPERDALKKYFKTSSQEEWKGNRPFLGLKE